jgi:hypothetical protein
MMALGGVMVVSVSSLTGGTGKGHEIYDRVVEEKYEFGLNVALNRPAPSIVQFLATNARKMFKAGTTSTQMARK